MESDSLRIDVTSQSPINSQQLQSFTWCSSLWVPLKRPSGAVIGKNSNNPLSLKTKSLLSALTAFQRTPVQQDIVVDQATPPESRLALVNEGFMGPIPMVEEENREEEIGGEESKEEDEEETGTR